MADGIAIGPGGSSGVIQDDKRDRRARISAKPGAKVEIYGKPLRQNILNPLYQTGGLLFPYTPMINDTATVNYESYDPVHSNQPFSAFKSVAAKEITVIGTFTTMNKQEAAQNLANIHFLRTITKMYFGTGGLSTSEAVALRGTPPPILMFNAYGTAIYHNVPVIVTSFNVEMPQDVDYVQVKNNSTIRRTINNPGEFNDTTNPNGTRNLETPIVLETDFSIDAWLPTRFMITVQMTVQNTPDRLRREFNLDDFRTGRLIGRGGWV